MRKSEPLLKEVVAVVMVYEKLIQKICDLHPGLDSGVVKQRISRLARETPINHYAWALEALSRVQSGKPLPWEQGSVAAQPN